MSSDSVFWVSLVLFLATIGCFVGFCLLMMIKSMRLQKARLAGEDTSRERPPFLAMYLFLGAMILFLASIYFEIANPSGGVLREFVMPLLLGR